MVTSRATGKIAAVDFLVVGVQKAGTTSLHNMLRQHPGVFMPGRKELHFFDRDDAADWACPDYSGYEGSFIGKRDDQVAGEATPIYSYWPGCIERIGTYNPDIKLILTIRNPAERAFSHWSMETRRRLESLAFADAIREGRSRVADDPDAVDGHHRIYSYVERGFYARQIRRILARFPENQLLVLKFDDLQNDVNGYLDAICRFLGVPGFFRYPRNRIINPAARDPGTGRMSKQDRNYLLTLFETDIRDTEALTGLDLSDWLAE